MKKKLAIAMAVIMTLAPMNLFAASNNRPSKVATVIPGKTLFLESTWPKEGIVDLDATTPSSTSDDIEYVVAGTDLIITLKDTVKVGDQIKLQLENAKWYFQNKSDDVKATDHILTLSAGTKFTSEGALLTYDKSKGVYSSANRTYTRFGLPGVDVAKVELSYDLKVSGSDSSEAILTVGSAGVAENNIIIPLVSLSTGTGDVRVKIADSNLTTISTANIQYGAASSTSTTTSVKSPVEARITFELDQVIIKENGISSIKKMSGKDDWVTITAPSGFTFTNPQKPYNTKKDYVTVNVEAGLSGGPFVNDGTASDRVQYFDDGDGIETDKIRVNLEDVKSSTKIAGKIYIEGLYLIADEDAPWGDINLKIDGGEGISSQTFKAGKRVDWTIEFKSITTVPTIVNGRYVSNTVSSTDSNKADDARHLAANVSFTEQSVAAWWSQRITTFDLSKGAKFRKVEIKDSKELATDVNNNEIDQVYKLQDSYTEATSTVAGNGSNSVKYNSVVVDGNRITINGVTIKKDKKASFVIKSWISVESGVEGDVTLTAAGSAVPQTLAPVVIAKAVSPITIDTKVTDVKVGYQWQSVADFTITETAPGMLERNKQVVITLNDEIAGDYMYFTPGSVAEVIGSWKLRDFESNTGAITFVVDRISTDKAAAVKFTNVNVKIDRTVAETNRQPYKLIVGGSAIAENYQAASTSKLKFDRFTTKGIKADYVKVITSGTNSTGTFTTVVKVTIGDKVIAVGQGTMEMDTAAFIDTASASTMVPVRFISQALGIPEGQIKWSDTDRTVTILAPNRTIQFTIGSSDLYINGSKISMISEEGYPVKAMIVEEIEGRSFIPFRALGDALGVTVAWDAETKTATYNADLTVK